MEATLLKVFLHKRVIPIGKKTMIQHKFNRAYSSDKKEICNFQLRRIICVLNRKLSIQENIDAILKVTDI